ncbi:hypothetical protein HC891_23275 [Candidatus Gracilibacteria bacterium]|nr:hypothetical protein [Candidatus Gracilibacteria bacterium]
MRDVLSLPLLAPAASVSSSRERVPIALIVVHRDPRPAAVALAAFTAPDALRCPHYCVAADGTLRRLVPEIRAAHHSGLAVFRSRVRNLDRLSVGVAVEQTPGSPWPAALLGMLHNLLAELFERYDLDFRARRALGGCRSGRNRAARTRYCRSICAAADGDRLRRWRCVWRADAGRARSRRLSMCAARTPRRWPHIRRCARHQRRPTACRALLFLSIARGLSPAFGRL